MIYRFQIGEITMTIEFSQAVIAHLRKHAQISPNSPEAGGQLFAKVSLDGTHWLVSVATGPRPTDKRSRFFFKPNRRSEQREINAEFEKGNHYVGDWHTHPQQLPQPSASDTGSMVEMVQKSTHQLPGFLMVIVGTTAPPEGLWISMHSSRKIAYPLPLSSVADPAQLLTQNDQPSSGER